MKAPLPEPNTSVSKLAAVSSGAARDTARSIAKTANMDTELRPGFKGDLVAWHELGTVVLAVAVAVDTRAVPALCDLHVASTYPGGADAPSTGCPQ